jgi:tetratricopeptide (TPR) repeat protein
MTAMNTQTTDGQDALPGGNGHEERIVPIRPGLGGGEAGNSAPGRAAPRKVQPGGVHNRMAFAALAALILVALGVVFVLPRWVAQPTAPAAAVVAQPEPAVVAAAEPLDPELLARLEASAEQALARLLTQQGELEGMAVSRWGGDDWQRYLELIRQGDDAFLAKAFDQAVPEYEDALVLGETLAARAVDILAATLAAAEAALLAGDAEQAAEQFDLALAIDADEPRALAGRERAGGLPKVLELMAAGRLAESEGRLADAAENYRDALQIDSAWTPATEARQSVLARIARADFEAAMSAGLAALGEQDFAAATAAFQRALRLRPGAAEAQEGLAQADQGQRLARISLARVRATAFERQERWDDAIEQYRAALALDNTVTFAREGLERAAARADLATKLANLIDRPRLLFSDKVLNDAGALLVEARAVTSEPGPKLKEQVTTLQRLVTQAATPINVRLYSDNLTEVTVYRIGKLGSFDVQELDLRPGRYTVVGSRDGFRDVREILEILPGGAPEPLTIQCVDRI